jgi:uncharacterized protein YjbI with pentapeptide repeats
MTREKPGRWVWPFCSGRKPRPDPRDGAQEALLDTYLAQMARLLPPEERHLAASYARETDRSQARVWARQRLGRRGEKPAAPPPGDAEGRFEPNDDERATARAETFAVLQELDAAHKGNVVRFLHRAGLLAKETAIDLEGANLNDVALADADLWGANFSGARLCRAELTEARLSGSVLRRADLREATLERADLWSADLRQADLTGSKASLVNLGSANLSGAYLSQADLAEADLQGANLASANLTMADLREARMSKVNLQHAILWGSKLDGAELADADLTGADLTGASLVGAHLAGACLRGATVSRGQLEAAASLVGAILPDGARQE